MRGFSLVELSIVLVILGLLTGGILAGQSLIRAAELRSVTADIHRYQAQAYTFRSKYSALPGDLTNAHSFWGSAGGNGSILDASCRSAVGVGTQTCSGDGNGAVGVGTVMTLGNQYSEHFTFWQHLANAGLIEGTYTGIAGSSNRYHATAVNTPQSRVRNAYWTAFHLGTAAGHPTIFTEPSRYGNVITFGALIDNEIASGSIMTPTEAWSMDTKLDDGLPAKGKLRAMQYATCAIASSGLPATNVDYDATYALTQSGITCSLIFALQL